MNKKLLIIGLLLCLALSACKKDEDVAVSITELDWKLKELGLYDSAIKTNYHNPKFKIISYISNGKSIFLYGKMEGKLGIIGFDIPTKTNILNWTEPVPLDTTFTVNLGYGKSEIYNIKGPYIQEIIKQDNDYCFILDGRCYEQKFSYRDLYLISNQSYVKKRSNVLDSLQYESVYQWYKDTFIAKLYITKDNKCTYICYSMKGEELFNVAKSFDLDSKYGFSYVFDSKYKCVAVSQYECIIPGGKFERVDISTGKTIWISENSLADLPENTRIDWIFHSNDKSDSNMLIFNISYTLYSGEKGTRNIKLNIETGKIEKI